MLKLQGAVDATTRKYYTPKEAAHRLLTNGSATKPNYKCPECDRLLTLKNGTIKQTHFAHRAAGEGETACGFYNTGESDIHKHGKDAVVTIIEKHIPLHITRQCTGCDKKPIVYKLTDFADISAQIEYPFLHEGTTRRADVAVIRNGKMEFIIEVYHTHRTAVNNRPSNFCDIKAGDVIDHLRYKYDADATLPDYITFDCQRDYTCKACVKNAKMKLKTRDS